MPEKLTISIIIPAYNEQDYLPGCLDAIARQTDAPDQVLVVDNNSTDKTASIAASYSFVKVIHEKRQGLYFSRNRGVAESTGQIIGRIDADTRLDPDWVRTVRQKFADGQSQIITGPMGYYDVPFPRFSRRLEAFLLRIAVLLGYKFLFGANMAFRRTAWDGVAASLCNKPFLLEDIDMALHFQRHGMRPGYVASMRAMVSSRRLQDSPLDFWRYISGHPRTVAFHSQRPPLGSYFATVVFGLVYVLLKLPHMMFDPVSRRFRVSRLWRQPDARPDPMHTDIRQ